MMVECRAGGKHEGAGGKGTEGRGVGKLINLFAFDVDFISLSTSRRQKQSENNNSATQQQQQQQHSNNNSNTVTTTI